MNYSRLRDLFDGPVPVVQAPMAGVSTPQLAGAVSAAGALGSLGVGANTATQIETLLDQAAQVSSAPINLNFFAHPEPVRERDAEQTWLEHLRPLFEEFDAPPPTELSLPYPSFDSHPDWLTMLLDRHVAVVSFHFGLPSDATLAALRAQGTLLLANATSVAEARHLERAGIDVIVAQGWEAGGHRGDFLSRTDANLTTTALVPQVVRAVAVPVLAAGGIMDGAGIAAACALGASGAQLGTAFITATESSATPTHRAALTAPEADTAMTAAISGRAARGLRQGLIDRMAQLGVPPAYPVTYAAGKALVAAALAAGRPDHGVMWAGQGHAQCRALDARALLAELAEEYAAALERLRE